MDIPEEAVTTEAITAHVDDIDLNKPLDGEVAVVCVAMAKHVKKVARMPEIPWLFLKGMRGRRLSRRDEGGLFFFWKGSHVHGNG